MLSGRAPEQLFKCQCHSTKPPTVKQQLSQSKLQAKRITLIHKLFKLIQMTVHNASDIKKTLARVFSKE